MSSLMTMSSSHCDINRGQGPGLDRPASWPTRPFQDNLYDGTAQHTPLGPASDGCLLVRTAYTKEWVCKAHADCPSGYYCDNARECWKCDVISELLCDSLLGDDDCCAPDFAGGSGSCPAADYPGVAARCNETLGLRVAGSAEISRIPVLAFPAVAVTLWECCLPRSLTQ